MEVVVEGGNQDKRVLAVTCPEPAVYNVEELLPCEKAIRDRFLIEKLDADRSTASVPTSGALFEEFRARRFTDEAAQMKKDASSSTQGGGMASSLISAAASIEAAISEINLLIDLTSAIQNSGHLTTCTSFQLQERPEELALPLPQRLGLARQFFRSAHQRVGQGLDRLQALVASRQQYASKLSLLTKRWRLTQIRGEGIAADCSFGDARRLALLQSADGRIAVQPQPLDAPQLCTALVEVLAPGRAVRVAAWPLLHRPADHAHDDLNEIEAECSRRRHDLLCRQFVRRLVTLAAEHPSRPMGPAAGPAGATDLWGALQGGDCGVQALGDHGADFLLQASSTTLRVSLAPLMADAEPHKDLDNDLRRVLSYGLLAALDAFLTEVAASAEAQESTDKAPPVAAAGTKRAREETQSHVLTTLLHSVQAGAQLHAAAAFLASRGVAAAESAARATPALCWSVGSAALAVEPVPGPAACWRLTVSGGRDPVRRADLPDLAALGCRISLEVTRARAREALVALCGERLRCCLVGGVALSLLDSQGRVVAAGTVVSAKKDLLVVLRSVPGSQTLGIPIPAQLVLSEGRLAKCLQGAQARRCLEDAGLGSAPESVVAVLLLEGEALVMCT